MWLQVNEMLICTNRQTVDNDRYKSNKTIINAAKFTLVYSQWHQIHSLDISSFWLLIHEIEFCVSMETVNGYLDLKAIEEDK